MQAWMKRTGLGVALALSLLSPAQAQLASLLPNGEQTFVDLNGQPLSGGSAYFYIPSTTTPKTTWVDSGEAVPNANPVVLDSAGRAIVYGAGIYREVLKDQFGNTVWDQLTAGSACATLGTTSTTCAAGNDSRFTLQTRTVYLSGSGNYTPPVNTRQLFIRMIGGFGGGGGGGTGGNGGVGVKSSFNSIDAAPGTAGKGDGTAAAQSGNGSGVASFRGIGQSGTPGATATAATGAFGGAGQGSPLGGQAGNGGAVGVGVGVNSGGAGGSPEYVEILVNSPVGPYPYSVGTGGAAGTAGSGNAGTAGSPGAIIIDERY